MFATDFIFNSQHASDLGLVICSFDGEIDTASGGEVEFNVVKTPNRDKYTFLDSQINEVLTWSFSIMKNPCNNNTEELYLTQYEESAIAQWLIKRDGYHWMQFDQEGYEDIWYNVYCSSLTPYQVNGKTIGFNVTLTSDCGYGFTEEITKNITLNADNPYTLIVHGDIAIYILPYITINGVGDFLIWNEYDEYQNLSNGKETWFKNITEEITMDSDNDIIDGIDSPDFFSWYFLRLVNGMNEFYTDSSNDIELTLTYREPRRVIV